MITMKTVTIYTTGTCQYCKKAKELLASEYQVTPDEIRVDGDMEKLKEMMDKTQKSSVPQIFIGETYVGGFDALHELHTKGELSALLQ